MRPQSLRGDADLLARHVVDLEGDDGDAGAGRRMDVFEHQDPQNVRDAGQGPRPGAGSGADELPLRQSVADQMLQDRGPRRRHALAPDAVVAPHEAFEDRDRRRRRDRKQAMGRRDDATASGQRRDRPFRTGKRRRDASGRNNVEKRVPVGDLVEMDLVDRDAVNPRLGLRKDAEDGERCVGRTVAEAGGGDPCRQGRETPVRLAVAVGMSFGRAGEAKAEGPEAAVRCFLQHRPAHSVRQDDRSVGKNALPEVGKCVEHRGCEHVAGDAANRIEMDAPHAAGRRCTGIT